MANNYTKHPPVIFIDTAGTQAVTEEVRIQSVLFTSGTSAGSCVILYGTGTDGSTLFSLKTPTTESRTLNFIEPIRVPGLYVNSISGSCFAYLYLSPSDRPYL